MRTINTITPKYKTGSIFLGGDPEIFIKKGSTVIESSKIISKNGDGTNSRTLMPLTITELHTNKITRDGVQAELNFPYATCRQTISYRIQESLAALNKALTKKNNGKIISTYKISFDANIKIPASKLKKMSAAAKQLGCKPSQNIYGDNPVGIPDPATHTQRSAGGHIHLSYSITHSPKDPGRTEKYRAENNTSNIVKLLDYILGNSCVLIDRAPGNAERRKYYGRAGEFRLTNYGTMRGIEYRTLSNFWLKHPVLTSFVYGVARMTIEISTDPELTEEILKTVDEKNIITAINTNDYKLALKNYQKIKSVLERIYANDGFYWPPEYQKNYKFILSNGKEGKPINSLEDSLSGTFFTTMFEHFASKKLSYWFNKSPINAWTNYCGRGWESFAFREILKSYKKNKSS